MIQYYMGRYGILLSLLYCTSIVASRAFEDPKYGTHLVPLVTAVLNTDGPVLEMGAGDFSTPLLHALCSVKKRYLLSTDTDQRWLSLFYDLKRDWHEFVYVKVYDDDMYQNPKPDVWDAIGNDRHWSVVLIDHRPGERRRVDIQRLRSRADILVVHDTQEPGYGYAAVLATFKYSYVYTRYPTTTTLVSDTINVAALFS